MTKRGYKSCKPNLTPGYDVLLAAVAILGLAFVMIYAEEVSLVICDFIDMCKEINLDGRIN